MDNKITNSTLMKGSEVLKMLRLGGTAGYRLLKHWEKENILRPVRLPALKSLRYRRDEVEEICSNKTPVNCNEFNIHEKI